MNSVINCLTTKSTWDDLILYHEGPSNVKESRVMDLKLCYNTFKFKEGESLTQTFTRYKALINELVNDGIKLLKLEINTSFINGLPKKWLSLCQSLRNTNNVKDFELASLFGKFKYEENLIDNIYETKQNKSLVFATPFSTAFFSSFIIQDFQDSPDDEEDTRSCHEYLNDLEEEYQARALLAKSKRFFKKGTQRSSQHKPELRPTKDIEAKYNKVKAKLAFPSSSSSASIVKNKGLIAEAYEWDKDEVSSDDNEMVEVKVLMTLAEENDDVSKEGARNDEWVKISMRKELINSEDPSNLGLKDLVFVKSSAHDTKVTIPGVKRHWLSKAEGFILPNHDTGAGMLTRAMAKQLSASSAHECLFVDFLSKKEPKKKQSLEIGSAPYGQTIIGSRWVFKNKRDETRIVIKNKASLVAQFYNQQEGIDYDETFAAVARLEAIRIFLEFATYMNFIVYKMDIKSAFLNGKLKEEVYVKQPLGFESNEFPNHVYKLDKALYGLKQDPRAWYETLSTILIEHNFVKGKIDNTLFVYKTQTDVILANPKESYLIAVNRIFRYLKGACQLLGGKLVCWSAKKQQSLAISLAKAKYVGAAGCCANILWMKIQLTDYDIIHEKVSIFCDNTSAIAISNNLILH
nr:copia protein [Tanacetum cinerariifolium]